MADLYASAPTKEALLESITRFYCGTPMTITDDLEVKRVSDGKILTSVRVVKKGNRYRFEGV
jgi:hypothetical protein